MKMPNKFSAPSGRRPTLRMLDGGIVQNGSSFSQAAPTLAAATAPQPPPPAASAAPTVSPHEQFMGSVARTSEALKGQMAARTALDQSGGGGGMGIAVPGAPPTAPAPAAAPAPVPTSAMAAKPLAAQPANNFYTPGGADDPKRGGVMAPAAPKASGYFAAPRNPVATLDGFAGLYTPRLRDGGTVMPNAEHGGKVPGHGEGDKTHALLERNERVVSNDTLRDNPGLAEHLDGLRADTLGRRGKTVAQADADARSGSTLRANEGRGATNWTARALQGQRMIPTPTPMQSVANGLAMPAPAAVAPTPAPAYTPPKVDPTTGRYVANEVQTGQRPVVESRPAGGAGAGGAPGGGSPVAKGPAYQTGQQLRGRVNASGAGSRSGANSGLAAGVAIGSASNSMATDTDDYRRRFGMDVGAGTGLGGDLAARAGGVMTDFGAALLDTPVDLANAGLRMLGGNGDLALPGGSFKEIVSRQDKAGVPTETSPAAATPQITQSSAQAFNPNARILRQGSAPAAPVTAPGPAGRQYINEAVSQADRTQGDAMLNSVMGRRGSADAGLQSRGDLLRAGADVPGESQQTDRGVVAATNADINLRKLGSDQGSRDTANKAWAMQGRGIRVDTDANGRPVFSNSTGPEKMSYIGRDGKPTSEYRNTQQYAEGVQSAADAKRMGDDMERSRLVQESGSGLRAYSEPAKTRLAEMDKIRDTGIAADKVATDRAIASASALRDQYNKDRDFQAGRFDKGLEQDSKAADQAGKAFDGLFDTTDPKTGQVVKRTDLESQANLVAKRASGGKWGTLSQAERDKHVGNAHSYVSILDSARKHQNNGWMQELGVDSPDAPRGGLPTPEELSKGKLERVGFREGAMTPNAGKGDWAVRLPGGRVMYLGADISGEHLKYLQDRGVK